MDLEKVRKILKEHCFLEKGSPVLVGVSGGPDSLCLLELLQSAGYHPVAAVFDHQLRRTSADEVNFVKGFARSLNLPFFSDKRDIRDFAKKKKLSVEEAARICRYQFLFAKAQDLSAQAVAVGHHADDQVETVLMHFLRGSGMGGLRGMEYRQISEWNENIPLVRPLLDIWKEEIEDYCTQKGFNPVKDETNQDNLYFRNRIRNELIPYLSEYNPGIKNTIWRIADTIREDDQTLNELTETFWRKIVRSAGTGYIALDSNNLTVLSKGLQRRLIRKAISQIRSGLRDINFDLTENCLEFLKNPSRSSSLELSGGLNLLLKNDQLYLFEEGVRLPFCENLPQIGLQDLFFVDIPGNFSIGGQWVLSIKKCREKPSCELTDNKKNPFEVFLDADCLGGQITVRSRRAGDRFQPLGMNGRSQKLSDFLINEKMVLEVRDQWPLILSENKIAWIPGYRPAHFCRVKESTRNVLLLKLSRSD